MVARVRCYSGLAAFVKGDYYEAAKEFSQIKLDPERDSKVAIEETLAFDDIALYGGLCGLATFTRAELETNIIKNEDFRKFLELVPEVREMIMDFYNSEYARSLSYLERMKHDLALDLYLSPHVDALCGMEPQTETELLNLAQVAEGIPTHRLFQERSARKA